MATCAPILPDNYGSSKWVAGWLPIRFQLESDKWPVNNVDGIDSVTSITNDGGFARVTLAGGYEVYTALEYIKITGATVTGYNGVWQIRSKNGPADYTIEAPFLGNDTPALQRYYNNYSILVKVFTGIRPGHYLYAERPMSERGVMAVTPDANNVAEVDISSYVRSDLSPTKNLLCDVLETGQFAANDWYQWTSFYVQYAERYDVSDGTTVSVQDTAFETDTDDSNINYFWAINGAQQPQEHFGYSFGNYALEAYAQFKPSKFLTHFERPTFFVGNQWDLQIIRAFESIDAQLFYRVQEYDRNGTLIDTTDYNLPYHGEGVYRLTISEIASPNAATRRIDVSVWQDDGYAETRLSEVKTCDVVQDECKGGQTYLQWQNWLGGFDSWLFPRFQDYGYEIGQVQTIRRDIADNWDTDFRNGDTEDDNIYTEAYNTKIIRSQWLTPAQIQQIQRVRLSNKVYEVYYANEAGCNNYRLKVWLPDKSSFIAYQEQEKLLRMSLTLRDTYRLRIPGQ